MWFIFVVLLASQDVDHSAMRGPIMLYQESDHILHSEIEQAKPVPKPEPKPEPAPEKPEVDVEAPAPAPVNPPAPAAEETATEKDKTVTFTNVPQPVLRPYPRYQPAPVRQNTMPPLRLYFRGARRS